MVHHSQVGHFALTQPGHFALTLVLQVDSLTGLVRSSHRCEHRGSPIILQTIVADVDPRLWQPRVIGDPVSTVALHRFTATVQGRVPVLSMAGPLKDHGPGKMLTNVSVAEYDLGLYLPDMREPLQHKADYAIRVANDNVPWVVWGDASRDPEGGVNVLRQLQIMRVARQQATESRS